VSKKSKQKLTMAERTAELLERRTEVEKGGGEARQEKQHAQGKLTARERVLSLLDAGTFEETGMFARHQSTYFGLDQADYPADGVVTGEGAVLGRPVHVASSVPYPGTSFCWASASRIASSSAARGPPTPTFRRIAPCPTAADSSWPRRWWPVRSDCCSGSW